MSSPKATLPEWWDNLKEEFECPVCLDAITDAPIYMCENIQGHSICFKCHEALQKGGKECPICNRNLAKRRNLVMEKVVEKLPKLTCKFDGCHFKKTNKEALKRHEDGCEHRYVPCAYCDAKIGLWSIADHVIETHSTLPGDITRYSDELCRITTPENMQKGQNVYRVIGNGNPTVFLGNWCAFDELTTMFWVSVVGPEESSKNFKYTFRLVEQSQEDVNGGIVPPFVYCFEGTRYCVPCDLSHNDVKQKRCSLMLDKVLFEDALKTENGKIVFVVSIQRV